MAAVASGLRQKLGGSVRARWTPVENMHLTVRFIGHVDDERVPAVVAALKPSLGTGPVEIAFGRCGVFPSHGPPRVLWIGVAAGASSLKAIHDELNDRLRPLGFEPETRPYSAHLTLARVQDVPRAAAAALRDAMRTTAATDARCRIDHATVFESRPSPRGSTYFPLVNIPLS